MPGLFLISPFLDIKRNSVHLLFPILLLAKQLYQNVIIAGNAAT